MAAQMHESPIYERHDRSIAQLIRDFTRETTALLRDEVDLAKSEVSDKISQLGSGLTHLGVGALVMFAGLLVLLDAIVLALMQVLPASSPWLAPLIVGGIVAVVGAMLLASGREKVKAPNLQPERTLRESRRDRQMLKEKLS